MICIIWQTMINSILASLWVAILFRCPTDTILRPHYCDQIKISDLSLKGQPIHYILNSLQILQTDWWFARPITLFLTLIVSQVDIGQLEFYKWPLFVWWLRKYFTWSCSSFNPFRNIVCCVLRTFADISENPNFGCGRIYTFCMSDYSLS